MSGLFAIHSSVSSRCLNLFHSIHSHIRQAEPALTVNLIHWRALGDQLWLYVCLSPLHLFKQVWHLPTFMHLADHVLKHTAFYLNILWNVNLFCDQSWIFSIITPVFRSHDPSEIILNMLICCIISAFIIFKNSSSCVVLGWFGAPAQQDEKVCHDGCCKMKGLIRLLN